MSVEGTGLNPVRYRCRREWQFDQWFSVGPKNVLEAPANVRAAGCIRGEPMIELTESWTSWRQGVVAVIRREFQDVFDQVDDADIDWEAWRPLFEEGRSPKSAVDRAFLRDVTLTQ